MPSAGTLRLAGGARAPRAARGCARGRARRRVRFPARLGGASHPRVRPARDGRPLRRPLALARGAVRVSLAAAHPARGRGRGCGGARARLLRRRALAARRGHRARAPPRRCCTRSARAERPVRRGTHVARARAAARANGQRPRNRARSRGGARRGRRSRLPSSLGADACAIRIVDGDELLVTAVAGSDAEVALGVRSETAGWLSGEVAQSRKAVAVSDASSDPALLASDAMLAAGYSGVPRRPARRAGELPPRRDRRVRARPTALARRKRPRRCSRSRRTPRPPSRTRSSTSASRSRRSAAPPSSRTSRTGSSRSIATGTSCSGTGRRSR